MPGQATVNIGTSQWAVSLATTPDERYNGLAGVPSIPAGTGMFFDEGYSWIINVVCNEMLFPLDIAFIDSSLIITDISRNVAAGTPGTINPTEACRYFLEVNAGEMADVNVGDLVEVVITEGELLSDESPIDAIMPVVVMMMMMGMMMSMMRSMTAA